MHRIFEAFVESLAESATAGDLHTALAGVCSALDLQRFAYVLMPDGRSAEISAITNYPAEWTALYGRSRYVFIDPVVARALSRPEPFIWGAEDNSALPTSEAHRELFEQAAVFGIRYGFTVPIHDGRGGRASLTFAVDEPTPEFRRCVDKKGQALQLLAVLFHAKARRILPGDRLVAGISLSPRQLECLEWAARGKSAADIADILGISRRTAAFHIEQAKSKLGVRTISQAVAMLASSRPPLV